MCACSHVHACLFVMRIPHFIHLTLPTSGIVVTGRCLVAGVVSLGDQGGNDNSRLEIDDGAGEDGCQFIGP